LLKGVQAIQVDHIKPLVTFRDAGEKLVAGDFMKFNTQVLAVRVGVECKFWIDPYLQGCTEIVKCLTSVHSEFEVRGSIEQLEDRLITWKRESMSVTLGPFRRLGQWPGQPKCGFSRVLEAHPRSAVDLHNDGLVGAQYLVHRTPRVATLLAQMVASPPG
jgi:hypothetical protein